MIGAKTKYVVFDSHKGEELIAFPCIIQHSVMADDVKKSSFGGMHAISGGFIVNGECVGRSESLRLDSRGDVDTALIAKMLDMDSEDEVEASKHEGKVSVTHLPGKNKAKRLRKKNR